MKKTTQKPAVKKKKILIIVGIIVLSLLMGALCYLYYVRLQETIKTESYGYIHEISKQAGNNVSKVIDETYNVLETLSAVLQGLQVTSYEQLETVVEKQQNIWDLEQILLFDKDGTAYNSTGKRVALSDDPYLQDVLLQQQPSLSTTQVIDGKDSIILAVPLSEIKIEGTQMVGLAVGYDLKTFDQLLELEAFNGQGYAHIIRQDGTTVIRSSSKNALETGFNILNSLSEADFSDNKTIADIQKDLQNGTSGNAEFTLDDAHEYLCYLSLGDQKWGLLTFVPVAAVNAESDIILNITLLICGFITLTFTALIVMLVLTFSRHKHRLEQIAYIDPVTGGHTIERFYEMVRERLNASREIQYALVYTNIEKFKMLNEQFGRTACDEILCGIEYGISTDLMENECIGRQFADNFCVLLHYVDEPTLVERFERWHQNSVDYIETKGHTWLPLTVEAGVFVITDIDMPFTLMIDRAKLSLNESAGEQNGKVRYAVYDERVRQQLVREKQLEDWMEAALTNHEFQIYLQAKYHVQSETIGGAEALVRWVHHTEGILFPDEFIPLFEKNGFVIQLDRYMFEGVCKILRRWLDEGVTPVKVSVNCSRLHLKNSDFLEKYCQLADQYQVPRSLLELELTENTVFEDVAHLTSTIQDIRDAGFGCSMDDFGSGFSSLNLIQDIPVDTLKLDKVFFRAGRNQVQSEAVITSILTLSKALQMETVAEGIEELEHLEMLKRLHCDYAQGYYFAKPMPVANFEQLAFGRNIS